MHFEDVEDVDNERKTETRCCMEENVGLFSFRVQFGLFYYCFMNLQEERQRI